MRHPQVFATSGTVVGPYGVPSLEVARGPERGWLVAAVGLAGKLLGPLGSAVAAATGAWPVAAVVLVLTDDLVRWLPFGQYPLDAWPAFRAEVAGGSVMT